MSFQWIIDNAQDVQINKRGVVATTIARDQTVRSVSRAGIVWRFTVTPATGLRYNDPSIRGYIETIDNLDRFTAFTASFSHLNLFPYQDTTPPTSITVTQGSNTATINSGTLISGDVVQLTGQPRVYSVYGNNNGTTVTFNRPVLEASGTYGLTVGNNVTFNLICTQLPDYKINPGNIVTWDKPFIFVEALPTP